MGAIEKFFGVNSKSISEKRLNKRSERYKAKLEESNLLREVNSLFVKGNTDQCFALLQKAVELVPNDFRPYYLLGLIHEENGKLEKALVSYMAGAILKKNDATLWRKVLNISSELKENDTQLLALEKINKKDPSEAILTKKLELLKNINKKYGSIACQIELFDYHGVDDKIFEKFEKTKHLNSLRNICRSLYKCIKRNSAARTEYFIRKTIFKMYIISDWKRILKLLDDYYFKENDYIHPEIRIIYIIAYLNINEFRLDPLVEISTFIEDKDIWNDIDTSYFKDLCEQLVNKNRVEEADEVIKTLTKNVKTLKNLSFAGNFYKDASKNDEAIRIFNQILQIDPVNIEAKSQLHDLYSKVGFDSAAKEFETHNKVTEFLKELEDPTKKNYRYSTDRCKELRNIFDRLKEDVKNEEILINIQPLIDDFLLNPFIFIKNRFFKSFVNKNEKLNIETVKSIIKYDEEESKRKVSEKLIRISCLHGLDVEEWFHVVQIHLTAMLNTEMFKEAMDFAFKCLEAHIFRSNSSMIMQLSFMCIRLSLMSSDLEAIFDVFEHLVVFYGISAYSFLYYLLNLFPDFYLYRDFGGFQKYSQRLVRKKQNTHKDEIYQDRSRIKDTDISSMLALCSFMPRFLQTETVDFICNQIIPADGPSTIAKGVICITHTKSRSLKEKKKYAKNGMEILSQVNTNECVKHYNLAKGYHFFGYYAIAESLYLKVIEKDKGQLKRMSIYNLSLIYEYNKSRKMIENLLSKFSS